jgi:hypothetical protein
MKNLQVFILCVVLSAVGLTLFSNKVFNLGFPLTPDKQARSWQLEAKVSFNPQGKPIKANLFLPQSTGNFALVDESFITQEYGLDTKLLKESGNRVAVWSKRNAIGKQILYYRAVLYELDSSRADDGEATPPKASSPYLKRERSREVIANPPPLIVAIDSINAEARDKSADDLFLAQEVIELLKNSQDGRVQLIKNSHREIRSLSALAALVINTAEIPARVANGVQLLDGQALNVETLSWLEVYAGGKWQAIDTRTASVGLEGNYFTWWYGNDNLMSVEGGAQPDVNVSLRQNTEEAIQRAMWLGEESSDLMGLTFFKLPVDTQILFHVLLLVPIGGLVISVLRQLIGLKTFGTFMPVLVALAFREMGLYWGIILFTLLVTAGLMIRAYFDRLQLLMVPRLSSVLTIVVILIALLTLLMNKLGLVVGMSISLFPMVILTMTIERMSLMWDEYGAKETLTTGFWSMVAASVCYLVISNEYISHLIFVFPELLLVVLSITILIGRYNGYKLTEYYRFRKLQRLIEAKNAQ